MNPLELPDSLGFTAGTLHERERILSLIDQRLRDLDSIHPVGRAQRRELVNLRSLLSPKG